MTSNAILRKAIPAILVLALGLGLAAICATDAYAASSAGSTKVSSISKKTSKGFTVTWKKLSSAKADGYEVAYSTNKNMSKGKTVTVKKAATNKKAITRLKAATTYYVKVRAYKKVRGKTVYGKWSSARSAMTCSNAKTGDSALNKQINQIIDKKIKKSGSAGLRKAFDYVVKMPQSSKGNTSPKGNWAVSGAKKIIKNKSGNCYESAALFCQLAKALGYSTKAVAGTTSNRPHGWVEVKQGGKWYVCDPNNTNTLLLYPQSNISNAIKAKGLSLNTALYMKTREEIVFAYAS